MDAQKGRTVADADQRPISQIFKDVVANLQEIVRSEVRLAKTEAKEEAGRAVKASILMVAGGLMALYALGFLLTAVMLALALAMPAWAAALVLAVVLFAVAGVALMMGRAKMRRVSAIPPKTAQSLKEDLEWAKNQAK